MEVQCFMTGIYFCLGFSPQWKTQTVERMGACLAFLFVCPAIAVLVHVGVIAKAIAIGVAPFRVKSFPVPRTLGLVDCRLEKCLVSKRK